MCDDFIPGRCLPADVPLLDRTRDANVENIRIAGDGQHASPNIGAIVLEIPNDTVNAIGVMLLRIDHMSRHTKARTICDVINIVVG